MDGDYVRHYLRAMAAAPQLAPDNAGHLLRSSSVIRQISYESSKISYTTFDNTASEVLRLTSKPGEIKVNNKKLGESGASRPNGWNWQALKTGGILRINHSGGAQVVILK